MGNDLLNELIRDISGDPLQLKRLETFIREKGFRSYNEALNELLNVYYGCEGRLKYSRILNEHIDKLSQISDKLAAISKTLGQFADVYVNLARDAIKPMQDELAECRGEKEALASKYEELRQEYEKLQATYNELLSKLNELQSQNNELVTRINEAGEKYSSICKDKELAKSLLEDLEGKGYIPKAIGPLRYRELIQILRDIMNYC
jgi:chromosome segregation ATPase